MAKLRPVQQYAGRKLMRKLTRAIPWVGAVIAVATIGGAMRRKGVVRGAIDTGLDAIPFAGAAKGFAEAVRGRDFIPDRPSPSA
jgi:hypothetical protein